MNTHPRLVFAIGMLSWWGAGDPWSPARADYPQLAQRAYVAERQVEPVVIAGEEYVVRRPLTETVSREEVVTVRRPIVETVEEERRYTVRRPVIKRSEREETYTVRRPIYETAEREQVEVVRRPVCTTAERQELVQEYEPVTTNMRTYLGNGLWTDSLQTQYVGRTVARRVPVSRVDYIEEQRVRKVPVHTVRYVEEQRVRKVPIETVTYVEEQRVRKVPVERVRYVEEQQVRRVPVEAGRIVEEVVRSPIITGCEEPAEAPPRDAPRRTYSDESDDSSTATPQPKLEPIPQDHNDAPSGRTRDGRKTSLRRRPMPGPVADEVTERLVPVIRPTR